MAEYIEREALISRIDDAMENSGIMGYVIGQTFKRYIKRQTAADVVPVRHGRWVCVDTDVEQFFLCNRCKKKEYWESNYCPNCGAKMDKED